MKLRLRKLGRETFTSLRIRNFRLFFYGQLVSQSGSWLTLIAQTLLVLKLTHNSGIAVGALTAFQFGPVLLFGAYGGAIADRVDKRRLLLVTQTLAMLQSFALGAVVFTHTASVPVIFALASVQGIITAFDNPSRRAFVVEMVPADDVNNAVSLNSAVMTGSRVVGPAAAGALVIAAGFGWCFTLDAISYLAVIYGLWRMNPAEIHAAPRRARGKGQIREGLRYIRSKNELFVPLVMMTIIGTLAFNFSVTLPLLVKKTFRGGDGSFTLLFSVLSLGSLVGALYTARRKEVTGRQLVHASAVFGIAMIALSAAPNMASGFLVSVVLGFASVGFMTASTSIVQLHAGPEYRGRVLAIQAMVFLGSTPIGGPIVGAVADLAGPRWAVALGGVSCLVGAGYALRALRPTAMPLPKPSRAPVAVELRHG
jgi:MFS family permease